MYVESIPRMPREGGGGGLSAVGSHCSIQPNWSTSKDLESPAVLLRYDTLVEGTIRSIVFY